MGEGQLVRCIDEIFLTNSNTAGAIQETIKKFGNKGYRLKIVGDYAGHTRQSSADFTDYERMKTDLSPYFQSIKMEIANNPRRLRRYNHVNSALRGTSKFQLKIHPRCSNLIEDLKFCMYKNDVVREIDKDTDQSRTHLSDSFGYAIMNIGSPQAKFDREVGFDRM